MADKKIGIFGGAFNPVHNGHLKLAQNYFDELGLDKLIFIPTAVPPHKSAADLASKEDRINMLALAVQGNPCFEISDIEFNRTGKSYTVETLEQLRMFYPDSTFYLIIGADQLVNFHHWYRYKDILDMVVLCTSAREDENEKQRMLDYARTLEGLDMHRFFLADYPVLRVSSSDIRAMIKNGQTPSACVPMQVCEYIQEKGLYIV